MRTLTHAQEQKRRRREKKKNAISKHKAFKSNHPKAFNEQRDKLLGRLVDLVAKTKYPKFQAKFILG